MGGKRKNGGGDVCVSSDKQETLIGREEEEEEEDEAKGWFFACYLLISLSPRFKGHTYIGFTVNPKRRIKQHNGELRSGAFRTKSKRPWEMALCIYGFPTNIAALQFEWAWQHPTESLAVRKAAANFKSLSGIANKVKLAFTMLTLPAWQSLDLTVNFFSTKYQRHCAGCPSLPEQMSIQVQSVDELPCYTGNEHNMSRLVEFGIEECDGLAEHGNKEYSTAGYREGKETFEINIPNYLDCRNRTEETTPALSIGESDFIWLRRDLQGGYDHHTQSSQTTNSLEEVVSPSHVAEVSQISVIPLREACSIELVPPPRFDLLSRTTPGKDKVVSKSSTVISDVEVVDLSTPEPAYRTSLQTRSQQVDSSNFIDLNSVSTESSPMELLWQKRIIKRPSFRGESRNPNKEMITLK